LNIAGDASGADDDAGDVDGDTYELPIKIFILNTSIWGMVAAGGSSCCTATGCRIPTRRRCRIFVKLADAFGCVGIQAVKPGDLDGAIKGDDQASSVRCCRSIAGGGAGEIVSR